MDPPPTSDDVPEPALEDLAFLVDRLARWLADVALSSRHEDRRANAA